MKIYIEELVLTNSIMYLTYLKLILHIFKFEASKLKILLSSFVGGLSSCILSIPQLTKIESIFFQIVLVCFISCWSYKNPSIKKALSSCLAIVLLSNIFSCILSLIKFFTIKNNIILSYQLPLLISLILLFIISLLIRFIFDIISSRLKQSSKLIETELEYRGKKIKALGLVDTGNNVTYKNTPVSFLNFEVFSYLTGINLQEFLDKKYQQQSNEYVTINSLAGSQKLLLFKLNKIKLKINKKYKIINSPQFAVSLKINKKDYSMVLNHNIL